MCIKPSFIIASGAQYTLELICVKFDAKKNKNVFCTVLHLFTPFLSGLETVYILPSLPFFFLPILYRVAVTEGVC